MILQCRIKFMNIISISIVAQTIIYKSMNVKMLSNCMDEHIIYKFIASKSHERIRGQYLIFPIKFRVIGFLIYPRNKYNPYIAIYQPPRQMMKTHP